MSNDPTTFGGDGAASAARIAELKDDIAAIKAQIAAADLERQANGRKIDARWFHRAKTALRHKQRELDSLLAQPGRKDRLKDSIIVVVRDQCDEATWQRVLDEAHRRLEEPC